MIEKIKAVLNDPKEMTMAFSGLALLGFYCFYARKEILGESHKLKKKNHRLELKLKALLDAPEEENIIKVVLTESPSDHRNIEFRSNVLSRLKQVLLKRQLPTLVGCSPLKILNSGCECFLETLANVDADDEREQISYYENALRCQLLIEKTIVDIEKIKREDKPVFILCDDNSMDLKLKGDEEVWQKFLTEFGIDEGRLKKNYKIVFHIRFPEGSEMESDKLNAHIRQIWSGFENYHEIVYNMKVGLEENIEIALQKILEKMANLLPPE